MLTEQKTERSKLTGLVREFYGRLVYSHKTHEKQREILSEKVKHMKWFSVVSIGLTFLSTVLGALYPDQVWLKFLSVGLSAVSLSATVYQLNFSFDKQEAIHRQTAKKLLGFRDKLIVLILKLMSDYESDYDLQKEFDGISKEVSLIYEYAPDTSSEAYKRAQKALKESEEMYFSEEELDLFLPASLRIGK